MSPEIQNSIYALLAKAETEIFEATGLNVKVTYVPMPDQTTVQDIETYLNAICAGWGTDLHYVRSKCKKRELNIMRQVLWLAAKKNFPTLSLKRLANLLERQDHTTVRAALQQANGFLDTNDKIFAAFYNPVKHLIDAATAPTEVQI